MKLPEVFKFSFDPKESELEVLQNRIGLILWSCLKSNHVTDQYFNDNVLLVAKRIEKEKPDRYSSFKKIIKSSNLDKFGQICVDETQFHCLYDMDHEYWSGIWKYINNRKRQNIEIDIA